eukprot:497777-Lingulodinium_polyedra.AAC.1
MSERMRSRKCSGRAGRPFGPPRPGSPRRPSRSWLTTSAREAPASAGRSRPGAPPTRWCWRRRAAWPAPT